MRKPFLLRRLLQYVVASFILHLVIVALLLKIQSPKVYHEAIPLNVTLLTKTMEAKRPKANQQISKGPKHGASATPQKLDLWHTNAVHPNQPDHEIKQEESQWKNAESYIPGGIDAFSGLTMADIQFEKVLWKEIDKAIEDHPQLSEYNHTGKVQMHFEIDENAQIINSELKACGNDGVLRVIAARAVRKALKIHRPMELLPRKRLSFNAQFAWSDYDSCKALRGIHKNNLSFCHYAEDKRKTFEAGEKAATYLKSLQYGIGAIEEIQKYQREENHRDDEFDPFESFKRDPDWNLPC